LPGAQIINRLKNGYSALLISVSWLSEGTNRAVATKHYGSAQQATGTTDAIQLTFSYLGKTFFLMGTRLQVQENGLTEGTNNVE
jgi:hypothetical protein